MLLYSLCFGLFEFEGNFQVQVPGAYFGNLTICEFEMQLKNFFCLRSNLVMMT